ncbi:hypothetical protein V8C26DRAFT_401255 [Trichoderma gracile]
MQRECLPVPLVPKSNKHRHPSHRSVSQPQVPARVTPECADFVFLSSVYYFLLVVTIIVVGVLGGWLFFLAPCGSGNSSPSPLEKKSGIVSPILVMITPLFLIHCFGCSSSLISALRQGSESQLNQDAL